VITATLVDGDAAAIDISTASTKELHLLKPDGTTAAKSGSFTTDGSDGKLYYQTVSGDIDQSGPWWFQMYVVLASGFVMRSSRALFTVDGRIRA
jgi:hypothetical protein